MPYKFDDLKVNCIAELLEQGIEPHEVASAANCSVRKVYQIRRNLTHFNTPRAPKLSVQGCPKKLNNEVLEVSILYYFDTVGGKTDWSGELGTSGLLQ
jgi:hypothetical protein